MILGSTSPSSPIQSSSSTCPYVSSLPSISWAFLLGNSFNQFNLSVLHHAVLKTVEHTHCLQPLPTYDATRADIHCLGIRKRSNCTRLLRRWSRCAARYHDFASGASHRPWFQNLQSFRPIFTKGPSMVPTSEVLFTQKAPSPLASILAEEQTFTKWAIRFINIR